MFFLYAKVYICTYYRRKDHFVKFFYDRLSMDNNHVWIHKTNIIGPKKIWVPKSISVLNDVGMHQALKT